MNHNQAEADELLSCAMTQRDPCGVGKAVLDGADVGTPGADYDWPEVTAFLEHKFRGDTDFNHRLHVKLIDNDKGLQDPERHYYFLLNLLVSWLPRSALYMVEHVTRPTGQAIDYEILNYACRVRPGKDAARLLERLCECGARLDAPGRKNSSRTVGEGLIHVTASQPLRQSRPVIDWLLDHGIDINTQDREGQTPLLTATREHRAGTALYLLERGASLDIRRHNTPKVTPLDWTRQRQPELYQGFLRWQNQQKLQSGLSMGESSDGPSL